MVEHAVAGVEDQGEPDVVAVDGLAQEISDDPAAQDAVQGLGHLLTVGSWARGQDARS